MKNYLKYLKVIIIFMVFVSIFFSLHQSNKEELVVIPFSEGKTRSDILQDLKNRGYVSNQFSVSVALFFLGDENIKPGVYKLKKNMGAASLASALDNPTYVQVYIPEGSRKEEVADILKDNLNWTEEMREQFLFTLPLCQLTGGEGYYAPGNYLIHHEEKPEIIKEEMRERTLANISDILKNPEENILNTSQILTIASLIQREAAGKKDMRIISGIIWNRIAEGMPLQIDATLQYIKGDEELWWPTPKPADKDIDSLYNTYQYKTLPPGPIANPGIAAIEAAINPAETDCVFYLHDKRGNIHCSTTYSGHKRNISYYLP